MAWTSFGCRLSRSGFTLLELLVVVSIIVVLLSLFISAIDRAMRAAEFARCATHERAIGHAGLTYALEHDQMYPVRVPRDGEYQPDIIGWGFESEKDLRPLYQPYVTLEAFVCPFAGGIDLSPEGNDPSSQVFANYTIFMGWQYTGALAGGGMRKLDNNLGFVDGWAGEDGPRGRSRVIVGERCTRKIDGRVQTAHPDEQEIFQFNIAQNQLLRNEEIITEQMSIRRQVRFTSSGWSGDGRRSTWSLNYTFNDGSTWRTEDITVTDDRMMAAPAHADSEWSQSWKILLPRH